MDITTSLLTTFGFRAHLEGIEVEIVWEAHSGVLAIKPVPHADAALALAGRLLGLPVQLGGSMPASNGARTNGTQQLLPTPPVTPPQQYGAGAAPPITERKAPAPDPMASTPPVPVAAPGQIELRTSPSAPSTPPPISSPQGGQAALPEDAVFGRAARLGEVLEELIRRGAQTADALVAEARAVKARRASPVLDAIDPSELEERVRMTSVAALALAGL